MRSTWVHSRFPLAKAKSKSTVRNVHLAVKSADAFLNLSQPFLKKIGTDMTSAHERAVHDLGGMIASATSMSFAVELYIKALRLRVGLQAGNSHDLWGLFKGLPFGVQSAVAGRYDALRPTGDAAIGLELDLALRPFEEADDDPEKRPSVPSNHSLQAVLKRNKDAFQTWRYLHERGDRQRVMTFRFEFHLLQTAGKAIRAQVVAGDMSVERVFSKNKG